MASLVTGIYDLIAGDPTKRQQNELGALGGYETGVGEGLTTAGATFDEAILSGDPTRISQALAPEISSGQQRVQQQKSEDAQFAPRSGGIAASTANAETAERGNLINLTGGLQSGTAGQALSAGSGLLTDASGNIISQADLAHQRQQQEGADVGGIAKGAAEIAMAGFGGAGDMGGGLPTGADVGTNASGDLINQFGTLTNEGYDPNTGAMTLGGVGE